MNVYMDHASTTPVDPRVVEKMMPYFMEKYGNPSSSLYEIGREARKAVEESRVKVASAINAAPGEIIFTSGGTEGDNLAIKGTALLDKDKKHIIISSIEHFSVLSTCDWLKKQGFEVTKVPVDRYGVVDLSELENAIRKDTALISVMHANNEIGTIEPIEEIGRIASDNGIIFHTNACQTAGRVPIDVRKMDIDLMTLSSHKIYGPKGAGAIFVRKGTRLEPLFHGGGHERKLRSGTENVPGIVGFGEALDLACREMRKEGERLTRLRDRLIRGILKIERSWLNGHPEKRLPNNAHFCFKFIEGESMILELDFNGISGGTGSACSSPTLEPSHVLSAIGLPKEDVHGSLRLTLGKQNTKEEVDYVIEVLPKIIERLRNISPFKEDFGEYESALAHEHKH